MSMKVRSLVAKLIEEFTGEPHEPLLHEDATNFVSNSELMSIMTKAMDESGLKFLTYITE